MSYDYNAQGVIELIDGPIEILCYGDVVSIILAPFAAGLILYWTMTNILTIIQQWIILRKTTVKTK